MTRAAPRPAIVLVEPLIPGNTGTIARTCAALEVDLCLVHPLGFSLDEKAVRRAGLDYWPHVPLHEYADWDDFASRRGAREAALFPFEEFGPRTCYEVDWPPDAHLLFGSETVGLPGAVLDGRRDRAVRLPMRSPHVRSLNLSNAVAAAAYVAFRGLL
ncbi:tRNA (cytidine(34)-2'-O)-methyltransferase [Jannaschia sp. Os4]|uniref:TrmH family RNA methyltransferase n=1 Tax=Jannaschia sp. Os4 TaxID=2807617 RepID=UPI00193A01C1|nr:tRNA (cytidine(34)-2'-O)-methyltransferase [Jannaschia sp. Os4]